MNVSCKDVSSLETLVYNEATVGSLYMHVGNASLRVAGPTSATSTITDSWYSN